MALPKISFDRLLLEKIAKLRICTKDHIISAVLAMSWRMLLS